jgi:hypothetical protein
MIRIRCCTNAGGWRLPFSPWSFAGHAEQPGGKEIAEVIVQGIASARRKRSRRRCSRGGQRYSEITAQEDVGRLLKQGWFPTNGATGDPDPPDGRISVYVQVTELPNTIQQITYRAPTTSTATTRQDDRPQARLAHESAFNQAARQSLIRAYHEKGRY